MSHLLLTCLTVLTKNKVIFIKCTKFFLYFNVMETHCFAMCGFVVLNCFIHSLTEQLLKKTLFTLVHSLAEQKNTLRIVISC